ncbi:GNAT family N-acetyltransferase [Sandaracinus amylolyticus]|uniref:GNAT family N-acetyltransferase n=1 Tax=Sandaracinus amylolyticus TaxID=927083 RepID=UPI0012EE17C6|nr:GNAT family N-acetyltransferase [Sandaracinus amylolyticus]
MIAARIITRVATFDPGRLRASFFAPLDRAEISLAPAESVSHRFAGAELVLQGVRERSPRFSVSLVALESAIAAGRLRGDLVASMRRGDAIVGFLWVEAHGPATHVELYVREIVIRPDHRGAGLGSEVLARLDRAARDASACALTLDFMDDNPRVAPLYARAGFERVGVDLDARTELAIEPSRAARIFDAARDLEPVLTLVEARRLACDFRHPHVARDEIRRRLLALGPDQRVVMLEDERGVLGLAWCELVPSALDGALVCVVRVLHVEPDRAPSAIGELLDAVRVALAPRRPARLAITMWSTREDWIETLSSRGARVARHKMRKALV